MFTGSIIEESLDDKNVLKKIKIVKTKIEKVTEEHHTPHLKQWTIHEVEISEDDADKIAEELSKSLDSKHGEWYADFKNDQIHYVIFKNKVFKIDRAKKEQYDEATKYGISLGIPDYQVDFSPFIKAWKR